jgi:hypothetical protein
LIVVVTDAEVFLKVLLGVLKIVLSLRRDHTTDIIRTARALCVSHTSSRQYVPALNGTSAPARLRAAVRESS